MADRKKKTMKSRSGERRGYRRPWWRRIFRRGSSEDLTEYVSRMAVGPLFLITVVLVYGLTLEPSERRGYVEKLTNPGRWLGKEESSERVRPASETNPVPVEPALMSGTRLPDPAALPADTSGAPVDTSAASAEQVEGSWIVVKRGQTLFDIAREAYGDVSQWKRVWFYNLERLPKPEDVKYGRELFIPPPGELSPEEARRVEELLGSAR